MFVGIALAAALANPPTDFTQTKPTSRDLYIGCSLMLHEVDVPHDAQGHPRMFSADECALVALLMIAKREGAANPEKYKFCIPDTAAERTNPAMSMAAAYVDWFERLGVHLPSPDGPSSYMVAMMDKFPCPPAK